MKTLLLVPLLLFALAAFAQDAPASGVPGKEAGAEPAHPAAAEDSPLPPDRAAEKPAPTGQAPSEQTPLPPPPATETPAPTGQSSPAEGASGLSSNEFLPFGRPVAASADDLPPSKPGYVTNVFFEAPLRDALSEMAMQAQTTIIADSTVEGLITCQFKDVPLEDALRVVLATGNYAWRKMDGFILVGSAKEDSPSYEIFCETRPVRLNYARAEEVVNMLPESMKKMASFDKGSNTVLLTATPARLDTVTALLKQVDVAPRQIVLDARIVVVENGDLLNMGVQWNWPTASGGTFSNSELHGNTDGIDKWPWGIQLGYTPSKEFTDALLARLNLLVQNEQATIVANPQVMAVDGKEAQVAVTTDEYFEILTQGIYTQSQLEKIESGTTLKITPTLNASDEITLTMETEASDVVARGQDNLPVVSRRTSSGTVRVPDGGTAVIAGLADNRTRSSRQRVPGVSKVPVVGRVFRNDQNEQSSRQILILVTPHLLRETPPGSAAGPQPTPPPKAALVDKDTFVPELTKSLERAGRQGGRR